MKILEENQITLKELREKLQDEPAIIIHDDTPVMVVLPVEGSEHNIWTEPFMAFIKDLAKSLGRGSNSNSVQNEAPSHSADPGMVEVNMAVAGIATAIAAFLPEMTGMAAILRLIIAIIACVIGSFSAYSALWLLTRCDYTWGSPSGMRESVLGIREVLKLLTSVSHGPYWLMALGLLALLVTSVLVCVLAVMK